MLGKAQGDGYIYFGTSEQNLLGDVSLPSPGFANYICVLRSRATAETGSVQHSIRALRIRERGAGFEFAAARCAG